LTGQNVVQLGINIYTVEYNQTITGQVQYR